MTRPPRPAPRRGFTLIEALVTMALLVVILTAAVPAFRDFSQTQAVRNAAGELASALVLARSEAVMRRAAVSVVARTQGGSTRFENGWQVRSGTTVLREWAPVANAVFTASATTVAYGLDGRTNTAPTVHVAPASGASGADRRCVTVDTTGLPRVQRTTAASC